MGKHKHYCYTTMDLVEGALTSAVRTKRVIKVKCGETQRNVRKRISEQAKTGNASNLLLLHSTDGVDKPDYEFHEYLDKTQGLHKSKDVAIESNVERIISNSIGSEWFDIPLNKLDFKRPPNSKIATLKGQDYDGLVYDFIEAVERYIKSCYEEFLGESQTKRYEAGLIPSGAEMLDETLNQIEFNNAKTVLWGACPRAQKTKMSLFMSLVLDTDIVVVCSYVLSAFTSFEEDADYFLQTYDKFIFVDSRDPDYRQKVNAGLKSDKKVVVLMSLCGGVASRLDDDDILVQTDDQRRLRMGFIKRKRCSKFWIVDEADFGAHLNGQFNVMQEGRKKDDVLLIMTGTNPARAVSNWKVDYYSELLYTDMIIDKVDADEKAELKKKRAEARKRARQKRRI